MDTPDKNIQPSSTPSLVSKFEDSPVFNYISSLSPIKPFSLGQSGQSFPLLNFASPHSAQPSPHTSCNIPRVIHVSDVSKDNGSESGNKSESTGSLDAVQPAALRIDEAGKVDSAGEVTVSAADESSKLVNKLPKSLKYEFPSTVKSGVHCDSVKLDSKSNVAVTQIIPLKVIHDVSKEANLSFENEIGVREIHVEQNKGVCDWEKFICEASDMMNYHSPTLEKHQEEPDDRSVDSGTLNFVATVLQAPQENVDDIQKTESPCPFMSSENNEIEIPFHKPAAGKSTVTSLVPSVHYSSTEMDEKSCSGQQQRTRRRCLVYEMSGAHYRKLLSEPADGSPRSKITSGPNTSNEKGLITSRSGSNKFSSLLPGIGLHLNALAATTGDKIIVKRQTLTCRRQLISSPCTMSSSDPVTSDAKPLNTQIAPDHTGNVSNDPEDGVQVSGSVCQSSISGEGVQFSQSSPKKKRRKSDIAGETDSCKRCNCKRSKCLKLYCECFAAGLYCVEPCNCHDCLNKPIHEETVLETRRQIESRNPLAFAPKVIMCLSTPHNRDEVSKTPASARHKRGCNCKKSGCLKKYCECFQGGVGCSLSCRCEGCKNTFGQKEGSDAIAILEEAQMVEKNATSLTSHDEISKTVVENQEEVTQEPSKNARQSVRLPFHFGGNVPQFLSLPGSESSLQPCESHKINKSDENLYEEDVNITPDDEALEVLKGDYSLSTYIKSTSPNCKRVSPHCDFETSPGWRSCRKLILRSIPSFPTLTLEQKTTELQEELE